MRILIRWAVGAIALFLTIQLADVVGVNGLGIQSSSRAGNLGGIGSAFVAILALTLVNAIVRPLVRLATAPLNCLTFGLFSFVVNALMFWLVGALDIGLRVENFWAALFGSLALSVISGLLNTLVPEKNEERR